MIYLELNNLTVFSEGKETDNQNLGGLFSVLLAQCAVFLLVAVVFYCCPALHNPPTVVSSFPNSVKREKPIVDMTDV